MTALMVGAARTTEEKIHVHGLHFVSTSTPQRSPTAGPAQQGSVRSGLQHQGSIERRDALLNLEIIRRALARAARAAPAAGVLNPDGLPALPKGSAGLRREDGARKACTPCLQIGGMSKGQQNRQAKKARNDAAAPDPVLVELVKLLARAAAERDYIRLCRKDSEGKATGRQGE